MAHREDLAGRSPGALSTTTNPALIKLRTLIQRSPVGMRFVV